MININKAWGREEWIVNNELYCFKRLIVDPGWCCSYHYHPKKDETFVLASGAGVLCVDDRKYKMLSVSYAAHRVKPGSFHCFYNPFADEPFTLYEISTHHENDDVVRKVSSKNLGVVLRQDEKAMDIAFFNIDQHIGGNGNGND